MDATQIITFILASGGLIGGLSALYKARNDRRSGVENHEIEEQSVTTKTFVDAIATQKGLIDTLEKTVRSQSGDVAALSGRVAALEVKLDEAEDEVKSLTGMKTVLEAHIVTLVDHINKQLGPPPPVLPGIKGL